MKGSFYTSQYSEKETSHLFKRQLYSLEQILLLAIKKIFPYNMSYTFSDVLNKYALFKIWVFSWI